MPRNPGLWVGIPLGYRSNLSEGLYSYAGARQKRPNAKPAKTAKEKMEQTPGHLNVRSLMGELYSSTTRSHPFALLADLA